MNKYLIIQPNEEVNFANFSGEEIIVVNEHIPSLPDLEDQILKAIKGKTSIDFFVDLYAKEKDQIKFIFLDYLEYDFIGKQIGHVCLSRFLTTYSKKINQIRGMFKLDKTVKVTKNFNFLANKSRPHRIISSAWISQNCEKLDFTYTSSDFCKITLEELLTQRTFPSKIGHNKILPIKFFDTGIDTTIPFSLVDNFLGLMFLYEGSVLSFVTEPAFYECGFLPSEKTVNSFLMGQMILWPGHWRCAESLSRIGFDVFDDILDHSYQNIINPIDRVIAAYELNRKIIFDTKLQEEFRNDNVERFQKNHELCFQFDHLRDIINIKNGINDLSVEYKNLIESTWSVGT